MSELQNMAAAVQLGGMFAMAMAAAMVVVSCFILGAGSRVEARRWETDRLTRGLGGYAQNDDYLIEE